MFYSSCWKCCQESFVITVLRTYCSEKFNKAWRIEEFVMDWVWTVMLMWEWHRKKFIRTSSRFYLWQEGLQRKQKNLKLSYLMARTVWCLLVVLSQWHMHQQTSYVYQPFFFFFFVVKSLAGHRFSQKQLQSWFHRNQQHFGHWLEWRWTFESVSWHAPRVTIGLNPTSQEWCTELK